MNWLGKQLPDLNDEESETQERRWWSWLMLCVLFASSIAIYVCCMPVRLPCPMDASVHQPNASSRWGSCSTVRN